MDTSFPAFRLGEALSVHYRAVIFEKIGALRCQLKRPPKGAELKGGLRRVPPESLPRPRGAPRLRGMLPPDPRGKNPLEGLYGPPGTHFVLREGATWSMGIGGLWGCGRRQGSAGQVAWASWGRRSRPRLVHPTCPGPSAASLPVAVGHRPQIHRPGVAAQRPLVLPPYGGPIKVCFLAEFV